MKVLFDNDGQTCNKFWCYVSALQDSLKQGTHYCVPFYDESIEDYPALRHNKYFSYPLFSKWLNKKFGIKRYMYRMRSFLKNGYYDLYPLFLKYDNFVQGWDHKDDDIDEQLKPQLLKFFKPRPELCNEVEKFFKKEKEGYDLILGVHMRHGDYKTWRGGIYYYHEDEYKQFCEKVLEMFPDKRIRVFIATDEPLDEKQLNGLDYFCIQKSSSTKDLYALSLCDMIIGPPSSFSRWAAFCGNIPISFITDNKPSQFRFMKIANYTHYAGGERIEFEF